MTIQETENTEWSKTKNEAKARDWRYKCLALTAKTLSSDCNHVLTGHTGSDRAETLLLNLARGSGLAGISSLEEIRKLTAHIQLVRPLLGFNRNETAKICQQWQLPVWIDPSNQNTNFSRNRIRQEIMPLMMKLSHPS